MKISLHLIAYLILFANVGCTVYRSPERKEFESESSQFRVQNLKSVSCSPISQKSNSSASRLVTILDKETESQYLWEHIIDDQSYFESDNLQGEFCVYQKT